MQSGHQGTLLPLITKANSLLLQTRSITGVRSEVIGVLNGFDKHWNLVLTDSVEYYFRPKKQHVLRLGRDDGYLCRRKTR